MAFACLAASRSTVFALSLRARLTLALTASLIAGGIATIAGTGHLVALHAEPSATPADFRNAVWSTLLVVAGVANVAGLLVVVLTARTLGSGVRHLRDAVQSLSWNGEHDERPTAPPRAPAGTSEALRPVHEAVQAARVQLHAMLDRVRMERDRNGAIIDTVFASVFAVDGGGRIIHANAAAAHMFDRPMHALTGVVLSDMIATESLQMSVDEFGTVTFHAGSDAGAARFRTTLRVFGRRAFPAEVSVTPLALEGQRAWAVFVHDLSAQQQAEADLQASRDVAEQANRAKTAFLARIGGEFRAPLDATIGFTQAVLRSRSSQLSERDRHYLEKVQGASSHLLTLVGDVLDLAQLETGIIALEAAPTDVTGVVQSIVAQFEEQVAGRPVLLDCDVPETALIAHVDAERMRQVLTNLVSNAVKFTARGTIRVTVCRQGDSDRASAVIVRDTGIGIPLDRQSHIFDLFAQSEPGTTLRYGGSGLGLALSRRLATEMGCMLSVESMPGAGSTFTLSFAPALPVAPPASRTHAVQRR